MTHPPTERLVVGQVRGLHGLRGAMRVEVLTDDPTRFAVGSVLHPEGGTEALTVTWVQEDGPGILVRFREIADRDAAGPFRERYLEVEVPRDALPAGAYYWHEVIGTRVTTTDGRDLGSVRDVFRAGGGEVFIVDGGAWGEVMVPAVGAVIREFAPADGHIVVDADGLGLDEEPPAPKPRGRRTSRALKAGRTTDGTADPVGPDPAEPSQVPEPAASPVGAEAASTESGAA